MKKELGTKEIIKSSDVLDTNKNKGELIFSTSSRAKVRLGRVKQLFLGNDRVTERYKVYVPTKKGVTDWNVVNSEILDEEKVYKLIENNLAVLRK